MTKKTGIYLCSGCNIGEKIDLVSLKEKVESMKGVEICETHTALCSANGISQIQKAIDDHQLDGVVIGACSSRVKTAEFVFDGIITGRVNIREQVAWCMKEKDEDTLMMAEDYLAMGLAQVNSISLPESYQKEEISKVILVVGGGISGITAALEGAGAGYRVVLVESEEKTGGFVSSMYKRTPVAMPYQESMETGSGTLIEELKANGNITLHTSTHIKAIEGEPGLFRVTADKKGEEIVFNVGSIVLATGWKPYPPHKLNHLGYGSDERVITNVEFEQLVSSGEFADFARKHHIKQVTFIQCAGSRDKDHLPYCSSYCCNVTLKQAGYVREFLPGAQIFIIYKDIRAMGKNEHFYKKVQQDKLTFMTKGEVKEIVPKNGKINTSVTNTIIGEDIELETELVVLATGMVPAGSEMLNLKYRQGKGLPELRYDFSDSHFICFPYETRRTGIYAAGAVRAPQDISACMEDASGAMMKAIQCVELTGRGEAVHPRSGDRSFPDLYMDRCTECKRCTEECPFGMYDETPTGRPLPNPARCRRCGICLGSCPERIINFKDFSIHSVSEMIKAVHVPDEFEEKPRILVFACENDAYPAIDMAGIQGLTYSAYVRIIPVRCLGSVNKVWISDALSRGFDGILQIGCKPGDDYQCHFIHGSELTKTRGENIQETLESMMLEPERIHTEFVEINEYYRIPEIINDFAEEVEGLGPNPFKEM